MAGSLHHLVDEEGRFRFGLIENMGDAQEACEACFDIIAALVQGWGGGRRLEYACEQARTPLPQAMPRLGQRADDDA